jgi:hypothetical protein
MLMLLARKTTETVPKFQWVKPWRELDALYQALDKTCNMGTHTFSAFL